MAKNIFEPMMAKLKADPKKIVFTEGTDERILEASSRLLQDGFLTPVLVGKVEEVKAAAEKFGFDIYKYNSSQTEIIKSIKVTKEEDDTFWIRYSDRKGNSSYHCDTEITAIDVHPYYFAKNPLKVVMTYNGDEVK